MLQYFWHHTVQRREHGTENGKQTKPVQRREHRTENGNKQNLYNVGNTGQKTQIHNTKQKTKKMSNMDPTYS